MNRHPSEFEVQALAYWNLKKAFPIVRGEYKVKRPEFGRLGARLDIAIFDKKAQLRLIIEVKKSVRSFSTRQATRYSELTGVPCMYIRGWEQAFEAVGLVKQFIKDRGIVI